ncbi:MAG: hypothetical protein JNG88_14985 [Phycisphaerales bacterium]|nr:hypothetical protein [Phycisphaerales bacterium]
MAKLATDSSTLGQYTYCMALISPIVLFFTMGARSALVADAAGDFTYGVYSRLREVCLVGAALTLLGVLAYVATHEPRTAFVLIFIAIAFERIFGGMAELVWGVYQKRERVDQLAWAQALQGIGTATPFLILLPVCYLLYNGTPYYDSQFPWFVAISTLLGATAWGGLYWFKDRPRTIRAEDCDWTTTWPEVARLFIRVLPLGITLMMINLCDAIPRIVLKHQPGGVEALGFFGALAYFTMAANLLLIQAGTAASNRLARYFHENYPAFIRLAMKMIIGTVIVGVVTYAVAYLVGKPVLRILYSRAYSAHFPEFMILVLGQCVGLMASMLGIVVTLAGRFWVQVVIHAGILATAALLSFWWIPGADNLLRAAAWTIVIRNLVHTGLYGVAFVHTVIERAKAARAAGAT